jgi:hypothetical protein
MPLYFFDIREGDDLVEDDTGLWFPDSESAEREAAQAAACILRDMRHTDGRPRKVIIEVRDENHRLVTGASASLQFQRGLPT